MEKWKNVNFATFSHFIILAKTNANFATFSNRCFYSLEILVFLSTTLLNTFSWPILAKKGILKKFHNFAQNHGLTP